MTKYAGDLQFESVDRTFSLTVSSKEPMALSDLADTLKDIDRIFSTCASETFPRLKGSNSKKPEGLLAIEEYKTGSLELVLIPFFTGVASGVAANAVFSVFKHTMRRIRGKQSDPEKTNPPPVDESVITANNLKTSASKAVERTQKQRRSIHSQSKTFGLSIQLTIDGNTEEI